MKKEVTVNLEKLLFCLKVGVLLAISDKEGHIRKM